MIGLNVLRHNFEFYGNQIEVMLYDLGAQKFFRRFRKVYYTGAQAAFILFDLTNRESFNNIGNWYNELKEFTSTTEIPIVIVGNKTDLSEGRQVFYQEGAKLVNKLSGNETIKLSYIETSALTGENVEDAFNLISYHYVMKSKELEDERRNSALYEKITSILKKRIILTLSFVTESALWNPGLQIITSIKQLGEGSLIREYEDEKVFQYQNGLITKQHLYTATDDVSSSDGVLCIFDSRNKVHVNPEWKKALINIIENIKEKGIILIGIRATETSSWSQILEELNVDDQIENKPVDLFFFRVSTDFRLDIYDQLSSMLSAIEDKY
jgi:small GTP-binding protein